jgi:hypothetical protein
MAEQLITEPVPTGDSRNIEKTQIYAHILNGTWTHFSSVKAVKDISSLDCMVTVLNITDRPMNMPFF